MKRKQTLGTSVIGCSQTARHLTEHLDKLLTLREHRNVRSHLAHCPNCSAYLDSLLKTVRLYRTYPLPLYPGKAGFH